MRHLATWGCVRLHPGVRWLGSDDLSGGTPGKRNSVAVDSVDKEPPQLDRYFFKDDKTIVLLFNKSLDRTLAEQTSHYEFIPKVNISSAKIIEPAFQFVLNSNAAFGRRIVDI